MGLNAKQEEKLAEILSNSGTVIFAAIIAGQFFPDVYFSGIDGAFVKVVALIGALVCWAGSIYLLGD